MKPQAPLSEIGLLRILENRCITLVRLFNYSSCIWGRTNSTTRTHPRDILQKPLPPRFCAGEKIDFNAQINATEIEWCPIPEWLAGTWQFSVDSDTSHQTIEFRPDGSMVWREDTPLERQQKDKLHITSEERFDSLRTFGTLRDRKGRIWQFLRKPHSYSWLGSQSHWIYNRILDEQITEAENAHVFHETVGTVSMLYQSSNIILYTLQQHNKTVYEPMQDGFIKITTESRAFDEAGKLFSASSAKVYAGKRCKPFRSVRMLDGFDLELLFRDFLVSRWKSDLVPDPLY